MESQEKYENYPAWIVVLSNLVSLAIYGLGLFIMYKAGLVFSALYLVYILILEFRLIRSHCTHCFYWGKTCGFGKGRISRLLFKKGDPSKFCAKGFTWHDLIPDLLVTLIPLITGIILLIISFDLILLLAMILMIILSTSVTGLIRGKLACRYCKQAEIGCPALDLFNKGKQNSRDKSF